MHEQAHTNWPQCYTSMHIHDSNSAPIVVTVGCCMCAKPHHIKFSRSHATTPLDSMHTPIMLMWHAHTYVNHFQLMSCSLVAHYMHHAWWCLQAGCCLACMRSAELHGERGRGGYGPKILCHRVVAGWLLIAYGSHFPKVSTGT